MLKKEEDDLKDAILYFSPEQVDADSQCLLCGQLMGMAEFFLATISQSSPSVFKFEREKFAIKRSGPYSLVLQGSSSTPDSLLQAKLESLFDTFTTFHGTIDSLKLRCKDEKGAFISELGNIWRSILDVSGVCAGDTLSQTFQSLPYVQLPKNGSHVFLQASHILQSCKRRPYVLAGTILYKNGVLSSQLPPTLTRNLTYLHKQIPHITQSTDYALPNGCKVITVFVTDEQLSDLLPPDCGSSNRHCIVTYLQPHRHADNTASYPDTDASKINKARPRRVTCPELNVPNKQGVGIGVSQKALQSFVTNERRKLYHLNMGNGLSSTSVRKPQMLLSHVPIVECRSGESPDPDIPAMYDSAKEQHFGESYRQVDTLTTCENDSYTESSDDKEEVSDEHVQRDLSHTEQRHRASAETDIHLAPKHTNSHSEIKNCVNTISVADDKAVLSVSSTLKSEKSNTSLSSTEATMDIENVKKDASGEDEKIDQDDTSDLNASVEKSLHTVLKHSENGHNVTHVKQESVNRNEIEANDTTELVQDDGTPDVEEISECARLDTQRNAHDTAEHPQESVSDISVDIDGSANKISCENPLTKLTDDVVNSKCSDSLVPASSTNTDKQELCPSAHEHTANHAAHEFRMSGEHNNAVSKDSVVQNDLTMSDNGVTVNYASKPVHTDKQTKPKQSDIQTTHTSPGDMLETSEIKSVTNSDVEASVEKSNAAICDSSESNTNCQLTPHASTGVVDQEREQMLKCLTVTKTVVDESGKASEVKSSDTESEKENMNPNAPYFYNRLESSESGKFDSEIETEDESFSLADTKPCISCLELEEDLKAKNPGALFDIVRCEACIDKFSKSMLYRKASNNQQVFEFHGKSRDRYESAAESDCDARQQSSSHHDLSGFLSSLSSEVSTDSAMSKYWLHEIEGLNDVTLYVQCNADFSLLLLLEKQEYYEKEVFYAIWKGSLSHLAELDSCIKECIDSSDEDEQERPSKEIRNYLRYNNFSADLRGSMKDAPSDHDDAALHHMLASAHAEFQHDHCLSDLTLRSHVNCCYGYSNHVDETFVQADMQQRPMTGLPMSRDPIYNMDVMAKKFLSKNKRLSLV